MTVRRIRSDESARLKAVRLAALRDTPSAFGSTYEGEKDRPDAEWAERARLGAAGDGRITFLAVDDETDQVVGLVGGYRPDPELDTVDLVSMWTAPAARGRGVGRALVAAVLDWARAAGMTTVGLWVTTGNEAAQALYESMGFSVTGEYQPLPSDPCKNETRMVHSLRAQRVDGPSRTPRRRGT